MSSQPFFFGLFVGCYPIPQSLFKKSDTKTFVRQVSQQSIFKLTFPYAFMRRKFFVDCHLRKRSRTCVRQVFANGDMRKINKHKIMPLDKLLSTLLLQELFLLILLHQEQPRFFPHFQALDLL